MVYCLIYICIYSSILKLFGVSILSNQLMGTGYAGSKYALNIPYAVDNARSETKLLFSNATSISVTSTTSISSISSTPSTSLLDNASVATTYSTIASSSTTTANSTPTTTATPNTTVNSTTSTTTSLSTSLTILPKTIQQYVNRSLLQDNVTSMLNASQYNLEEGRLNALGVSSNSTSVVVLNGKAVKMILRSLPGKIGVRSPTLGVSGVSSASPSMLNISTINVSTWTYYGSITNASTSIHFPAGSSIKYALFYPNGTLSFITASVRKAPPFACIYVNLASAPFCSNATTPSYIHVPIIKGHYGLTNQTWYPLNISFRASLIGNQTAPFNFSVTDLTNGTALTPLTTITSNGIDVTENFKIGITNQVEITMGSAGDSNYTMQYTDPVTIPSNIIKYLPITLQNTQTSAFAANSQVSIIFPANTFQQYETSNLNNGEFFYANGSIIPSWLEGNSLNEQQTSNLYTSANIIYWVLINNAQNILCASCSNTIYVGWAGNVITSSNTLFDGITTGEAPQLSSTYAQYDDGSNVFTYYNINPASTSGWTTAGTAGQTATAPSGSHYVTTNAYYANSAAGDYMYRLINSLNTNEIISFDAYTTGLGNLFFLTNSAGSGQMARLDSRGGGDYSGLASTSSWTSWSAPSGLDEAANTWYKYDIVMSGSSVSAYIGSISNGLGALGTLTNSRTLSNNGNYLGLVGDGLGSTYITYWDGFIVRAYPPAGSMPVASFGSILSSTSPDLIIPTNPLVHGQSDVISASAHPNTDSVEILVNGVVEAGPATGTITYNANVLSVGIYTVNALDTINNYQASQTLVVGNLPTLSITTNPVPFGQSDVISASANPNTDNVEILVNGVVEAGPSSGTVNFNADVLTMGTYTVTAKDSSTGISTSQSLSVTCTSTPSSVPSGIGNYVCVQLTNSQSSAMPSPFQQNITVNSLAYQPYEAGNLQNIEFFNQTGSIIPSWLESGNSNTLTSTRYWVKLTNTLLGNTLSLGSLPASSNTNIYMGFATASTNLFSNTVTGEAPQLSSSYGEYDDGASVFDVYYNGASAAGWTTAGSAGATTSAPSGSPFGSNAFYANGANGDYMYTVNNAMPPSNFIMSSFWYSQSLGDLFFLVNSAGLGQMTRLGCAGGWYGITSTSSWTSWTAPPNTGPACNIWYKVDTVLSASTATAYYSSASTPIGTIGGNPSTSYSVTDDGNYIGLVGDAGGGVTYWNGFLVRNYPSGGVMPDASFSSVQAVSQNICSISLSSNAVNFGAIGSSQNTSANILITDTNSGNTNAYMLVYGSNWISGSNSFYVSNTVWSASSGTTYASASKLSATVTNTLLSVSASGSNSIYFGLGIPSGQQVGTYQQTITIENSC